jgi:hypothetical protein
VSKSKNNLTSLASLLTGGRSGPKSALPVLGGSSASSPDIKTTTSSGKSAPGSNSALRSESLNAKPAKGIVFGKPSSNRTSTSATSQLNSLLKSTENSALSSVIGGGSLFGGLMGLGSLTSLIGGLFGSSTKTLPALTTFSLPQVSAETFSIGTNAKTTTAAGGGAQGSSGIYASQTRQTVSAVSVPGTSSGQIAQVVKTALLNSSSLNDVINEI